MTNPNWTEVKEAVERLELFLSGKTLYAAIPRKDPDLSTVLSALKGIMPRTYGGIFDPTDPGPSMSQFREEIWDRLEDHGVDAATIEIVDGLIDRWEADEAANESENAYLRSQEQR